MNDARSLSECLFCRSKSCGTGLARAVNSAGFVSRFAPRALETWVRLTEAFNQLCRKNKTKKHHQQQNMCSYQRTRNPIILYFNTDYFQMTPAMC